MSVGATSRLERNDTASYKWSVPAQDFTNAAMGNTELPADVAGTHSTLRHFHDLPSDGLWKWTAIDENASELVHSTLTAGTFGHF